MRDERYPRIVQRGAFADSVQERIDHLRVRCCASERDQATRDQIEARLLQTTGKRQKPCSTGIEIGQNLREDRRQIFQLFVIPGRYFAHEGHHDRI